MKRFKFVMVSLAIFAAVMCAFAPGARADDQQEISDLEHKAAVATNPDQTMKLYESGDDVVLFDVIPPRELRGQKAIHDHLAVYSGNKIKVDFLELQVISDGKLALARSVQHLTGENANGKPIDVIFRNTDIWRKANGQWKLIHTHASFPVDLRTGKADMASKM
jgi:ketosteroid isomerase-like protein